MLYDKKPSSQELFDANEFCVDIMWFIFIIWDRFREKGIHCTISTIKGGLVTQCHNELRYTLGGMAAIVYKDVREPLFRKQMMPMVDQL